MTQGQQTVERVARLERSQSFGTVANGSHQKPEFVLFLVDEVDGYGTSEEGGGRAIDTDLHELSWLHLRQRLVVSQSDQHIALVNPFHRLDREVEQILLHKNSTFVNLGTKVLQLFETTKYLFLLRFEGVEGLIIVKNADFDDLPLWFVNEFYLRTVNFLACISYTIEILSRGRNILRGGSG